MSADIGNSYIVLLGWIPKYLGLRGNELMVFCKIYGYESGCYWGTLSELAEWTNSTEQGMHRVLNSLVNKGLITKALLDINGTPRNAYSINFNKIEEILNPNEENLKHDEENLNITIKKILNNNISNNISNNKKKDSERVKEENKSLANEVLNYFNEVCNTTFKPIEKNLRPISGRISEGYTFDDFKKVIDIKWMDWGEKPYRFHDGKLSSRFLRPVTIFGNNFESYLNEARLREISDDDLSVSGTEDEPMSDFEF